ncbi:MAG: peptidoglycan DD-metalloendopeptidase family protein [Bacteroidales bacterium]|jgi:murein DD-endopeptidase MepM/ murein hydrolase activator NlpD|nr:peptidoglycan DD-metalloendopeptidase family protein [Bacteroidales bacterium]MDD4236595.1 peptidoglycan DD-metalloendopeptidase family protein [Bacteroidales bacterium]MDY0159883.1 peptidoglycan DD-metalloendopeptidase family protein [Bacteroidales bacterium]
MIEIIKSYNNKIANIFPYDLSEQNAQKIDLSSNNNELKKVDLKNIAHLSEYIAMTLKRNNKIIGIGGYMEDREIYKKSSHFGTDENVRSIHLGIDLWSKENTPVYAPLDAQIHSFKINDNFGDYGPTIILEHNIEGFKLFTLYGHLSTNSLINKELGQVIKKGENFANLGNSIENGSWPPHLHFQIITDMQNNWGDFPGVCSKKQINYYEQICPNPNILLNSSVL